MKQLIKSEAPWTEEEVEVLKERQKTKYFHPYTCAFGCGVLDVNSKGLKCSECSYTQKWVHPEDATGQWREYEKVMERMLNNE